MGMEPGGLLRRISTSVLRLAILKEVGDTPDPGQLFVDSAFFFAPPRCFRPMLLSSNPCNRKYGMVGRQSVRRVMNLVTRIKQL